jgi:hypothetical protein
LGAASALKRAGNKWEKAGIAGNKWEIVASTQRLKLVTGLGLGGAQRGIVDDVGVIPTVPRDSGVKSAVGRMESGVALCLTPHFKCVTAS